MEGMGIRGEEKGKRKGKEFGEEEAEMGFETLPSRNHILLLLATGLVTDN